MATEAEWRATYEAKVDDLRRETLRSSVLSALAWRLFESLEIATAHDGPAWTKPQWERFLAGGFPPDERQALSDVLRAHGRDERQEGSTAE